VRGCQADVWRFACSLTRSRDLADDVTQESFVRAFRFLGGFRGDSRFSAWLLAIVRNCSMEALRRASRPAPDVDPSVTPDHVQRAEIEMAIDGLPQDLREPFLLIEVFGMTYADASVVLSTKVGTLKSRIFRARQILIAGLSDPEVSADEM
jgi:RNA polymerase sigma-70 factor (ECF subfamily)